MFEIGINSNNDCFDDYKVNLQEIKNAGFTNVMVAAKAGNFEEIIKETLSLGLKIPYVHLETKSVNYMWFRGEEGRKYIDMIKNELNICATYHIPVAVMHFAKGCPTEKLNPVYMQGLESMNEILQEAERCNVKIALENIDDANVELFYYLLDNINSEYLGFCYDVGHHQLYLKDVDLLSKYGDRLLAIHIHDNLMDYEFGYDYTRDLHRLPFDGKINYKEICEKLLNTSFDGIFMLELHKESCGRPYIYNDMNGTEFLKEASVRVKKLIEIYKSCE